jgi:hypothetical protein
MTDHPEAAHAASEYTDIEPPPRRCFEWPTPEHAGEMAANVIVFLMVAAAIASAIASVLT